MKNEQQALKVANDALIFESEPTGLPPEKKTVTHPMEWKNEYSVGIKTIDDQHKMLLHCFANIQNSIFAEQAWSTIHYSIIELKELALIHFAVEDALMELFGYPKIAAHQRTHQNFLYKLDDILNISTRKSANKEMLKLLEEWQKKHILGDDRDYADFILSGATVVRSNNN